MASQQAFEEITKTLEPLGVVAGQMFGMPVWKLNGKAIGGPWKEDMVFKLEGAALEEALKLPGAQNFDPAGGRPMKQWVQLGPEHAARWQSFAEKAASGLL